MKESEDEYARLLTTTTTMMMRLLTLTFLSTLKSMRKAERESRRELATRSLQLFSQMITPRACQP